MAVCGSVGPYLFIYKIDNDVFTRIATSINPGDTGNGCAFSADSKYLMFVTDSTPFQMLYSIDAATDVFTQVSNPYTGSWAFACEFSPDGEMYAVAPTASPYLAIYSVSETNVYTKLANPSPLPANNGNDIAFSGDGVYVALAGYNITTVNIYKIDKALNTVTYVCSTAISSTQGVCFSPDGNYLCIVHASSPFFSVFKFDKVAKTLTKIANPAVLPAAYCSTCVFSPDGTKLFVTPNVSPYIHIYSLNKSTDVLTKLANPTEMLAQIGTFAAIDNSGKYLGITCSFSRYPEVYKPATFVEEEVSKFKSKSETNNMDFVAFGYAKANGIANELKKVYKFPMN
jgi:WD40 repeat protein